MSTRTTSPTAIDTMSLSSTTTVTKHMVPATTSPASSAPTTPVTAAVTWLRTPPAAPTCSLAPAAQGAEEDISTNSPSLCSTDCLNHDIDIMEPISAAPTSPLAPAIHTAVDEMTTKSSTRCSMKIRGQFTTESSAATCTSTSQAISADFSMDANMDRSLECRQVRYIANSTTAFLVDVVFPCLASKVHDVQKVFEGLSSMSSVLLVPMSEHMVCKGPGPPPTHLIMQSSRVQLRPMPWPSFGCHTVAMQLGNLWSLVFSCSEKKVRMSLLGISWLHRLDYSFSSCQLYQYRYSVMHLSTARKDNIAIVVMRECM